jgi:predicted SprT family Zn-dependent metalloprotease
VFFDFTGRYAHLQDGFQRIMQQVDLLRSAM